ncbi:MAG: hypothetical protein ACI87E_003836, partial [Mariniblastus sp.]
LARWVTEIRRVCTPIGNPTGKFSFRAFPSPESQDFGRTIWESRTVVSPATTHSFDQSRNNRRLAGFKFLKSAKVEVNAC